MTRSSARGRRDKVRSWAARLPGVRALAAGFARVAQLRAGRVPVGLLLLLPVSILIDLFDVADELAGGIVGPIVSFLVESAFILGLTGRTSYAIGAAAFDVIPVVDIIPFATITLVREIVHAWGDPPPAAPSSSQGPIIDV